MPHVYSTLSSPQAYTTYHPVQGEKRDRRPAQVKATVVVAGGANIADKHFITPRGIATEVTEEQLKCLKECDAFNRHVKAGYVSFDAKKVDAGHAAKNMKDKDESAPLTKKSIKNGEMKTNKAG